MIIKNCKKCSKEFITYPSRIKKGYGLFCSRICINIGRKQPQKWIEMIRKIQIGKNNFMWKGDKASYRAFHSWIERQLGKFDFCETCGNDTLTHRHYHWANISGKYKRIITDWIRLCAKCHKAFDRGLINLARY